jgi:LPXTG-motif cell wall-anchored protein
MSTRHQGRKRAGVIAAAGFTALIGTGILASPASAHNPNWTPTCDKVTVDLSYYNSGVTNTVEIKAGGQDVLPVTTFGANFEKTLDLPAHTSALTVEMIIKAGDDTDGTKGYSVDRTQTVQPCQTSTPTPPPSTPTQSAAPSSSPSAPASVAPTQSAPAAVPSPSTSTPGQNLAETGSSSATPVIAGVAAVVVIAGGALVLVGRKRRAGAR